MFEFVSPGWGPIPLFFSSLAFVGALGGLALVVVTARMGLRTPLNRSVAAFGGFYGLWSLCFVVLFASPGGRAHEIVFLGASVGMFGLPVSAVFITLALGRWPRSLKIAVGLAVSVFAVLVVAWAGFRHRFFPELQAFSLDSTALISWEPSVPWAVFLVNGAAFTVGFLGLMRARAALGSRRIRRQVSLVIVQLLVGLGAYLGSSLAEWVFGLPPWGMVTLLYSLFLNFYLVAKYRYLRFDLPALGTEIIDGLAEAVFLLDPQGNILKSNPAAHRIFADAPSPLVGSHLASLFADADAVDRALAQVRESREMTPFPGLALRKGTATLTLTAHSDAFADLVGLVAIVDRSDAFDAASVRSGLTPRETEVALLVIQGLSVRQMAEVSFVSEATIKTHLIRLYRKSGATNRVTFLQNILQNR